MKKIISITAGMAVLLCVVLLLFGCGKASQGLEFSSNGDGTCVWTGLGSCTDTQITVPEKNGEETVVAVGANVLGYSTEVTGVVLPDSVSSVGDDAFYNSGITRIDLGNGVKTIGDSSFYSCDHLTDITLPASLEAIGENAFSDCGGLTAVKFPAGLKTVGEWAFSRCVGLTEVVLPEGLTELGMWAFSECVGVKVVSIPATLNEVQFAGPAGTLAESYGGHFDTTSLEELNFSGTWTGFDLIVRHEVNEDRTETFIPYYGGKLVRDIGQAEYAPDGTLTEANMQSVICAMLNKQSVKVNGEQYTMTKEKPVGKYHVPDYVGFVNASFAEDGQMTVGYGIRTVTDVFAGAYVYDEATNIYYFDASGSYEGTDYTIEKHMIFFGDFLYCYDVVRTAGGWEESVLFWTPEI